MIGICVVSHGELAFGLKDGCELISGDQNQFSIVGLRHEDDFDEFKDKVFNAIQSVNDDQGVLVFVDLFGASPFNAVLLNYPKLKESNIHVRIVSSVNLAMVIEACEQRNHIGLDELFTKVIRTGKEYIIGLDEEMNQTV